MRATNKKVLLVLFISVLNMLRVKTDIRSLRDEHRSLFYIFTNNTIISNEEHLRQKPQNQQLCNYLRYLFNY